MRNSSLVLKLKVVENDLVKVVDDLRYNLDMRKHISSGFI